MQSAHSAPPSTRARPLASISPPCLQWQTLGCKQWQKMKRPQNSTSKSNMTKCRYKEFPTPKGPPAELAPPVEQAPPPPFVAQRPPSPCAVAAQREDPAQRAAYKNTLQQVRDASNNIVEVDTNQPKLIEQVTSSIDIDWNRPLHEQLKPRLWGNPDEKVSASELLEL